MPAAFYDYDEANKHKKLWVRVWAAAIWVDDAGENDIAVIHWMGGAYKVVGRYNSHDADGIENAKQHVDRCSDAGYCRSTPADSEAYRAHIAK